MRSAIAIGAMAMVIAGCRCGPEAASPVTLRLKNTSSGLIFVDDSDGRLGMQVQRRVAGEWLSFVEQPACECQACDSVCSGCECDAGVPEPRVRKLAAGKNLERQWSGQVQVSGTGACQGAFVAGPACLSPENPPLDETFRLQLCYSPSAPGVAEGDGGSMPGVLPAPSVRCVTRDFRPMDGVVEVSPVRGAECSVHGDCRGLDELCFAGGCTSACLTTGYPELGGAWQVRIQEPDDQGFFTVERSDAGTLYSGKGQLGAVLYQNGTMSVRLNRPGPGGGQLTGAIYLTLPPGYSTPLTPGPTVEVKLLDASASSPENRALTVRELDGGLILAADTAQGRGLLGGGALWPFGVETVMNAVGCQHDECGKRLHFATRFSGGAAPVSVEPGQAATVVAAGASYRVLNAANYSYPATSCRLKALAPYAILRQEKGP